VRGGNVPVSCGVVYIMGTAVLLVCRQGGCVITGLAVVLQIVEAALPFSSLSIFAFACMHYTWLFDVTTSRSAAL